MTTRTSQVAEFIKAVNESDALREQCERTLDGSTNATSFAELAAKHGYKFTAKEAEAYFEDLLNATSATRYDAKAKGVVAGAKDEITKPVGHELKQAVYFFRNMSFKKTPKWTDFGF